MTCPSEGRQQRAAEARVRGLLKERDAIGLLAFERLQLRRRAGRLERVRERTREAVFARQHRQPEPDCLPFEEPADWPRRRRRARVLTQEAARAERPQRAA